MSFQPENPGDSIKPEWLQRQLQRVGDEIELASKAGADHWTAKATTGAGGPTNDIWLDVNATDWSGHPHEYGATGCLEITTNDIVTFGNGTGNAYLWAGPKPVILGQCAGAYVSTENDYEGVASIDHEILLNRDSPSQHPQGAITGLENRLNADEQALTDHKAAYNPHSTMSWKGKWAVGTYQANDVVRDGTWLMIANKQTTDRPAPQTIGDPYNPYDGTITPADVSAKQVTVGSRYSPQTLSVLVTGYRIYTESGQTYTIYLVDDPTGDQILTQLRQFTATTTGWQTFKVTGGILGVGQLIDLVALIQQPAPIPVTWTGDWDYLTPNNATAPGPGDVTHATRAVGVLWINYIDDNAGDRTTELQALAIGDTISAGGQTWTIQSSSDQGAYMEFGISPAIQTVAGVYTFTFETVTAATIDYQVDVDWWAGKPRGAGLFGADVEYETILPDDNQYILDLEMQDYSTSPDWDEMAN